MVGLEPPQAGLAGSFDMPGREFGFVGPVPHASEDFGGQHDFVPPASALRQPAADDLFGNALAGLFAVHIGGIEKVDAHIQRAIHDGPTVAFGGEGTKIHGAQTEPADFEPGPAKVSVFHCDSFTEWVC